MDITLIISFVLNIILAILSWYLSVYIPKKIELKNNTQLEELKSIIDNKKIASEMYANKIFSEFDEVLKIVGELKCEGNKSQMGIAEALPANWLAERLFKLELFAQTYWPFFINSDLKELILKFRKDVSNSIKTSPNNEYSSVNVQEYWESAEQVQKIIRVETEALFILSQEKTYKI